MTEIELRNDDAAVPAVPAAVPAPLSAPVAGLVAWAQEARAAANIAESLAKTSFVPAALRGKPAEITAAILTGQEMGLSPMASLRSIHMIQGTPSLTAHAQRGVALSKGHLVWVEESTDKKAVVCGQRAGADQVQKSTWTIARAEQAGLPNKNPNWRTQPQAMLIARATSEVCRMIAADALLGMPYTVEELQDEGAPVPAKGGKRRVASLAPVPAPAEEQKPEPADPWDAAADDSYDDSYDPSEESSDRSTAWPTPAPIPGAAS